MARKQLITPVSFLVLFLVTNFSIAQDMGCGTCGNFGTYGLGNETAVINHVFTCPAGNCNDAAGDFNFIGGSNSQDFFNTQTAINSMAYGDGARVNANESFVFGSNVDNNSFAETFVFGEGIQAVDDRSLNVGWNGQLEFVINGTAAPGNPQGVFMAPPSSSRVGIGTTNPPNSKFTVQGNGGPTSTDPAMLVRDDNQNARFNVRNDGAAGFNIPANPGGPRAPYQFEESAFSPFGNTQGKANIVQNYDAFPNFEKDVSGGDAKWLALGERPPASTGNQVAYGVANVWQNNAGNLILLGQDPNNNNNQPTPEKDVAITFQDVKNNSGGTLTNPSAAGNRLRFLFRDGQSIDASNSIYEIMSMEPTGEVGVGDYTSSTQQANLEVKAETQGNGDPIFQVRNNGGPGSRGDLVMTANDDGNVGIDINNPNRKLVVNGKQYVNTNSGVSGSSGEAIIVDGGGYTVNGTWSSSDIRLKTDTQLLSNALSKLEKLNGYTYRFADNKYTAQMNTAEAKQAGIIAQQLKSVLPEAVRKGKNGIYAVNYDAIIPLLIEANKSQQDKINQLQEKAQQVEKLKKEVEELQMQMQELTKQSRSGANQFEKSNEENLNQKTVSIEEGENEGQAMLLQNRPNPYSGETIIPYFLPKDFNNANMLITNTNGQIIKRINLEKSGKGELTLRTEGLNSGQYLYSLIVDGRKIQTRKMVVNK